MTIEVSSGNVFADLGLPEPDRLKALSALALELQRQIELAGMTREEATARTGVPVAAILRGDFGELSADELGEALLRLR